MTEPGFCRLDQRAPCLAAGVKLERDVGDAFGEIGMIDLQVRDRHVVQRHTKWDMQGFRNLCRRFAYIAQRDAHDFCLQAIDVDLAPQERERRECELAVFGGRFDPVVMPRYAREMNRSQQ